jgi:hypothetical protein
VLATYIYIATSKMKLLPPHVFEREATAERWIDLKQQLQEGRKEELYRYKDV